MDALEFKDNKFEVLDDNQKKITLGKLKQLENIVDLLNCMREGLTRELYVNGVEEEKDIIKSTSDSDSVEDNID